MNHRRSAMSLVEVLAALALLGTCVVTLLWAQTAAIRSLQTARTKAAAASVAEEMIVNWELENEDMRVSAEGPVEGQEGWRWQRTAGTRSWIEDVRMAEIRLTITRLRESEPETLVSLNWLEAADER